MGGGVEIERKFLLRERPPGLPEGERVEQGYLARDPEGAEVRVRRRAGRCTLTVKTGAGLVRGEEEIPLDPEEFDRLWRLTEGRRVDKTRHVVDVGGGLVAEVDVYAGALDGLLTAEVEFPSEEAAAAWTAPDWLGPDVTGDKAYGNARLATDGIPPR